MCNGIDNRCKSNVDETIVFNTIKNDLPKLKKTIQEMLNDK